MSVQAILAGQPTLRYSSGVKIIVDGNSHVAQYGLTNGEGFVPQVAAIAPLSGSGVAAPTNLGVSAQTWVNMQTSSDVNAAIDATKVNVLVLFETTNSVFNAGRSAQQVYDDAKAYITTVRGYATAKSAKLYIVIMESLPRYQTTGPGAVNGNNNQVAADSLMRSNLKDLGADLFVDIRVPGSPWYAFPNWNQATFERSETLPYWNTAIDGANVYVHLNPAGHLILAGYLSAALRRLKK